jgi:hypothetical protein
LFDSDGSKELLTGKDSLTDYFLSRLEKDKRL